MLSATRRFRITSQGCAVSVRCDPFEHMFYPLHMGTNRRYADRVDRQMAARAQQVASAARPLGLSPVGVDLTSRPARSQSVPVPILAWVQFTPTPTKLEGVAVEWNDVAVHVELIDAAGRKHRLWVWASAVERLEPEASPTRDSGT